VGNWSDVAVSRDPDTSAVGWPWVPANVNSAKADISTTESRQPYMTTVRCDMKWYMVVYASIYLLKQKTLSLYNYWPLHWPCVCVCVYDKSRRICITHQYYYNFLSSRRYDMDESHVFVVYHGRERRAAADDRTLWRSRGCVMRRDAARSVIGERAGPAIWVARWQSTPPRKKSR